MGKLINLLIGLFIALAGYILTLVNEAVGAEAAQSPLPFDVTMILSYTSIFFLSIGGILIGYSVITGTYSIIISIFGGTSKERSEEEEPTEQKKERRDERETDYEKVRSKGNEGGDLEEERFRKDSDDRERRR